MKVKVVHTKVLEVDGVQKPIKMRPCYEVVELVYGCFDLPTQLISKKFGSGTEKDAKHICQWILNVVYEMSSKAIGRLCGVSHTTVLQSIDKVNGLLDVGDELITSKIKQIIEKL